MTHARILMLVSILMAARVTNPYVTDFVTSLRAPEDLEDRVEGPNGTHCGENLCSCYHENADCSRHARGLQYIPQLPHDITRLNFSSNHLKGIFRDDFFQNVTNITYLTLYRNEVSYIRPGAFQHLGRLNELYMDFNNMTWATVSPVLTVPTLTSLSLRRCDLDAVPPGYFGSTTLQRLKSLILYDNYIGDTSLSTFQHLKSLRELGLAANKISHLHVDLVSELETINLNSNGLFDFPITCYAGNSSLFPKMTHLLLRKNLISSIGQVCLPSLKVLLLSENIIFILPANAFGGDKFPKLIELYLYALNDHIDTLPKDAFSNPLLERISLSYNSIDFSLESIDTGSFANCPHLIELQLSHNFLRVTEDRFLELFGHLNRMKKLFMEDCELMYITQHMLSGFPQLETLSLDRNRLSAIPDGAFDGLGKLKHLVLSNNQISVVSARLFSPVTRKHRLTMLDLSGNPFLCSCELLWFQNWLITTRTLFNGSWGPYRCFNIPGLAVQQFFVDEQACLLSHGASVMIVVVVSLVLLTMTMIVTVFRYRWHFRLVLYEAFSGHGDARKRRLQTGHFDYDIFVSHDSDDLPWVRRHLMPELEERLGLRLCLHQRDFTLGRNIVDNIADCVERSKKVMMLFSSSFVQSQWCQFELSLCLTHVLDYDDALIIVCLDDVPSRDLTAAMMAVLKTTTYIQWMDDEHAMTSFWGRLRVALNEIISHHNP
ncbi:toll-like receptor 13 [Littorina saxatilis]|uniref:toll-like receptor 13 n=1 Tax=Littorina saxatilis TaxID=31220 RepID=UPI0038B6A29B